MSSEQESNEAKKVMAYDLICLLEEHPEQKTYTMEEVKKLIKSYIKATTSK